MVKPAGYDGVNFLIRSVCVVSLDVVGYSRMISADARKAVEKIRILRRNIASSVTEQNGRLFGSAGDGYLVEFKNVESAVRFALDLQYSLKRRNDTSHEAPRLSLRAGIAYGEVIDDEGELHGDCINIAVRLQEAAPSGGIVISEVVNDLELAALRLDVESLGALQFKNITHRVPAFAVALKGEPLALSSTEGIAPEILRDAPGFERSRPLAVLPFENLDADSEIDYICSGIRDELVSHIAKTKILPVVDPVSSGLVSSDLDDLIQLGKQLRVSYLVIGSISMLRDSLVVSIRLLDTATEYILWNEKYQLQPENINVALDAIVLRISGTVGAQIERNEGIQARSKQVSTANVTDLIWRGRWHMTRLTAEDSDKAHECFRKALEVDAENPEALIQLGYLQWIGTWVGRRSSASTEEFHRLGHRAMVASDNDARAHFLLGVAHILRREIEIAKAHLLEAIRLNPSFALAYAQLGSCEMLAGRPREAIPKLELSLSLNPADYYVFYVLGELAASHCMLGNWDAALDNARKSMSFRPFYWHARMTEINASVRSGNTSDALRSLNALYARRPDFSKKYIDWLPFVDQKWRDYFYEGVAQARDWSAQSEISS